MLDSWKEALETLIYGPPTSCRPRDALHAMDRAQRLACVRTVAELRRYYLETRVTALQDVRDRVQRGEVLSPREIEDAAFGLRYLELVTGRRIDARKGNLIAWLLGAVA
jgi:hypothetical protein